MFQNNCLLDGRTASNKRQVIQSRTAPDMQITWFAKIDVINNPPERERTHVCKAAEESDPQNMKQHVFNLNRQAKDSPSGDGFMADTKA